MRRLNRMTIALAILAACGGAALLAQSKKAVSAPSTVLHVITVKWKADATAAQKQAALDGVRKMAAEIPGITNVWLKTIKVQPGDYNAVIAIEFKDKAALDADGPHESHKAWEKIYIPIRERSTTHDVTN